jgi:alkylated DNA repair dioxygenase AlkB
MFDVRGWKLGEGTLLYVPKFIENPDELYEESKKLSFTPETVKMFGKISTLKKRQTVDYGVEYSYNAGAKKSIEWEPLALAMKQKLEESLGKVLQQCACNWYLDPEGYISAHVDKSTVLPGGSKKSPPKTIVSLSLGAERIMALRPINAGHEGQDRNMMITLKEANACDALLIALEPGSLVIFDGVVNHAWKHAIPQSDKAKPGERISLTYREF